MFIDVVRPDGNEEEFIDMAKKLGVKGLVFLHDKDSEVKDIDSKDVKIYSGVAGSVAKKKLDYRFSTGERAHFENKNTDVIFDIENSLKQDKTHYRNSGLNQVLCSLAKEKKILIGFNFNLLLNSKEKDVILGRMIQNVALCRKYKVKMLIASFARKPKEMRSHKDLISFGVVIGMGLKEAKNSVLNRNI